MRVSKHNIYIQLKGTNIKYADLTVMRKSVGRVVIMNES